MAAQTITFTIGTQSCAGITDATGAASCNLTLNQVPGPYTVAADFAGAGLFQPSSASTAFTITREETTLNYTGDTVIANNTTAHLSGVLLEDGYSAHRRAHCRFHLRNGRDCADLQRRDGRRGCCRVHYFPVNQPPGAGVVAANFAGDAFYLPSSVSEATIIFAFLDHGSFVVGDQTDTGSVEFWAAVGPVTTC